MTDFTDYLEQQIRDWMSQGTDMPTAPGNIHVGLHNGAPGDDAATNEVSGNGYARVSTTAATDWNTPANGQFENASEIQFPQATGSWGTISHVSLWDASTGGNAIAVVQLSTSVTVDSGETIAFPVGDLSFEAQ